MNLDRLGDITSELTSSLLKSIVLPGAILDWLKQPLSERLRRAGGVDARPEGTENRVTAGSTGPLVLMGGKPVPDEAIVAIIHLLGGRSSKIAVIPVAAGTESVAGAETLRLFTRFGMRHAEVLPLPSREQAASTAWCDQLNRFDAFVLCGEDVALGLDRLNGTLAAARLRALSSSGKLMIGLDAGASIMADRALVPQGPDTVLVPGLGVLNGTVVETGFAQKSRFPVLMKAIGAADAGSPIGLGLDGGAAAVVLGNEVKVLGDGSATFLDSREREPGGASGAKVHVLNAGFGFQLRLRKPVGPSKEPAGAASER